MVAWWDGVPRPTDAEIRAMTKRIAEPDRRLGAIMRNRVSWTRSTTAFPDWAKIDEWAPTDVRSAALAWHVRTCQGKRSWSEVVGQDLARRDLGWTREELMFALDAVAESGHRGGLAALQVPIGILRHLDPAEWSDLRPCFEQLFERLGNDWYGYADERRYLRRALGEALEARTGLPPRWVLPDHDDFGPAVRSALAADLARPGVGALLAHCAAIDRRVPTNKWCTDLDRLLDDAPTGRDVARSVLDLFVRTPQYVHDDTDRFLRGLVWIFGEEDVDVLVRFAVAASAWASDPELAGHPYAPNAADTAVERLDHAIGDAPTKTRRPFVVTDAQTRARVEAALAEIEAMSEPADEPEPAVDDHGLAPDGTLHRRVGDYLATIQVEAGKARLTFSRAGKPLTSVPAPIKEHHGEELAELKKLVNAVGGTLRTERSRIEAWLSDDLKQWSGDEWVALLSHPITGAIARPLIFETSVDGSSWTVGLPGPGDGAWSLTGLDGGSRRGELFRLWHPVRAGAPDVMAWRDHLHATGLRQPVRQVFREVYLLTPVEAETDAYSTRFAGHILRYDQAFALMRGRGWKARYMGHDDLDVDVATKVLGGGRWRAVLEHQLVAARARRPLCALGEVRFEQPYEFVWAPATVTSVPDVVLSEAMRDVDLFVGVASIAADPEWINRGDLHLEYWREAGFGGLTPSAEIRRDALARILPRTKIAAQVELDGNYLRVQGTIRTYRIHLGSANVLMEPNDAYLCIVAVPRKPATVRLPFDDDATLSLILSKAFLLAADDRITDRTIVAQIRRA